MSLCLLLLAGKTEAQPAPTNNQKTVRTETCWTYPIINGVAAKKPYCSARIQYKRDGSKSKMTLYDATGQVTKEYLYAYSAGQCETYQILADGSKRITNTERYDSRGNVTEHVRYTAVGSVEDKKVTQYDRAGKKTREEYFVANEEVLERVYAIQYDYTHNAIRESYINYRDQESQLGATVLDENQLPREYNQYASSGEPIRSIRYDRNVQGRLTSVEFLTPDKAVSMREDYEYNGSNMHCLVYQMGGKELVEHVMYQYDYYQ
jgi:hypothetical protein